MGNIHFIGYNSNGYSPSLWSEDVKRYKYNLELIEEDLKIYS